MKTRIAAPVFVALLWVVSAAMPAFAAQSQTPDSWITMKTKIALMTADNLNTSDLNVDTVKGVVTIHGKVPTAGERSRAEEIAKGIDGVKGVKNVLTVVPESQERAVERSDTQLKEAIDKAFTANRRVNDSGVKIASVNSGVVLLNGTTKSLQAHLEAIEVAKAVPGVKRVASEVQVETERTPAATEQPVPAPRRY